jgi:hypothetical protein
MGPRDGRVAGLQYTCYEVGVEMVFVELKWPTT